MSQKIVSIVVPVFNEEKNIPTFYYQLSKVLKRLGDRYVYEIVAVDDGSSDSSVSILQDLSEKDQCFHYIEFSRNFGKEIALSAGIDVAHGDAVIMLDADLQHPVELIPEFLAVWEKGAEIVVGVRKKNSGEGWFKKCGSFLFYKIMDLIGETKITPRATDYRLLDKKVVREFRRFTEHNRITRGLIDWLGFRREYIYFDANKRLQGNAGYSKIKLLKLALSAFISHSLMPLRFAGYLGIVTMFISGTFGSLLLLARYVFHNPFAMSFTGSAQLAFLILFLVGVILSCLGLVALYIGNIINEVAGRPNYVLRKNTFEKDL